MSDPIQQWYGALPVTARRQLDENEVQHLVELRREARGTLLKFGALFGAFAVVAILTYLFLDYGAASPGLLIVGLLGLFTGDRGRRLEMMLQFLRSSQRDLETREIVICESEDTRIEVLAESGALWTDDGVRKLEIVLLTRTSTAAVPDHARMAAQYVRPIDEEISSHQRPLSDGELREIARCIPSVPVGRTLSAFFAVAAIIGGLLGAVRLHGGMIVLALIGAVVAWRALPPAFSIIRTRQNLRRDIDARCAVIVRRNTENVTFEVLPYSGVLWTENAEPAMWRKIIMAH